MELLKKADDLLKKNKQKKSEYHKKLNNQRYEITKRIVELDNKGEKRSPEGKRILDELIKKRREIIKKLESRSFISESNKYESLYEEHGQESSISP